MPDALAIVVPKSLNVRSSFAVLWEFKYVLIGTASTWFLIDGAYTFRCPFIPAMSIQPLHHSSFVPTVTFYGQSLMNTTVVNSAIVTTAGLNAISKLRWVSWCSRMFWVVLSLLLLRLRCVVAL